MRYDDINQKIIIYTVSGYVLRLYGGRGRGGGLDHDEADQTVGVEGEEVNNADDDVAEYQLEND